MRQDLGDIARRIWEKWGRTPEELFGRITPSQFVALFTRTAGSGQPDKWEELRKFNDDRGRKGLRPVFPSWIFGE